MYTHIYTYVRTYVCLCVCVYYNDEEEKAVVEMRKLQTCWLLFRASSNMNSSACIMQENNTHKYRVKVVPAIQRPSIS